MLLLIFLQVQLTSFYHGDVAFTKWLLHCSNNLKTAKILQISQDLVR